MRLVIVIAVVLATVPAGASAADLVVDGRGWGHGVGMSQYGAYGYARDELRDHRFILNHYYAGSGYATVRTARIRVRLRRARVQRIGGAAVAVAASGRRVRLFEERLYRFQASGRDRIAVVNTANGNTRARLLAPVRVSGGSNTTLRGKAD